MSTSQETLLPEPPARADLDPLPFAVQLPTPTERHAAGKAYRKQTPRPAHAVWHAHAGRVDPVSLLEQSSSSRLPHLVPIRYGRMMASPYAFYRGSPIVMAHDLAATPVSGINVQCCGDAHLMNFGVYASPERNLLFDLNDFDETLPGPWEWDLKRLAASIAIAARGLGLKRRPRRELVREAVGHYRRTMRDFAPMHTLDAWYAHLGERDFERLRPRVGAGISKRFDKGMAKAGAKDSQRAFNKLTERVDGGVRITPAPPLIQPVEDL